MKLKIAIFKHISKHLDKSFSEAKYKNGYKMEALIDPILQRAVSILKYLFINNYP